MRLALVSAMPMLLAACATTHDYNGPVFPYRGTSYIQASWARMSVQETWERCMGEVQSGRFVNHYYCMKANGYESM